MPEDESKTTRIDLLVLFLAFCSGFTVMALELLGGRILAPYFGSSVYVWGSLIVVFMLALAAGYLTGGRLSLHRPSLFRFGLLFALSALAMLPLVYIKTPIMVNVFNHITDPRYGALVAALLLFFIPTCIMGMISPYAVRLLVRHYQFSGQISGRLYFVSTFGSALGTLMTSFYLVLWFRIDTILWGLVALMALAAILIAMTCLFRRRN